MFLGKVAERQDLKDIVVKLTREKGDRANEERVRLAGAVTRDLKPLTGGRVGAWRKRPKEMNRVNVAVHRGRTVPMEGYETAWSRVAPDGTFSVENLKPGSWFLSFEQPGRASTVVGPIELKKGERTRGIDVAAVEGGAIEGRAENVPPAMAGLVWVVAFDGRITRREARVAADGTFRLENLPPGRYGLKVGHDAYKDPHIPALKGGEYDPEDFRKKAEPWQGAVSVTVEPGATARGVVLDFRPPGPLVEKEPK